uniref:Uncharacterized protein n=1 Tax=Rhizophora mucronata TaxID=61149 RepID=A0A2P2IZK6_RHIMU
METEVSSSNPVGLEGDKRREKDPVRVKRKTLQAVLEECHKALELLSNAGGVDDDDDDANDNDGGVKPHEEEVQSQDSSSALLADREAYELCNLLKSRVKDPDFLEKLESGQVSHPQNIAEEVNTWDVISENDLWEGENSNSDQEDYVLVQQEDIVEGIACFMAAYLLSLKQTKDLTPNQLQEALSKTFSVKKRKGKLRKAWEGSKVIYNAASWAATAIGIYQNPMILRAASKAFWTSRHVILKLL